jgi:hypothetical protein
MAKKRYNLVLPQQMFDEVQAIAVEEEVTVLEIFRRFIKFGLLLDEIENNPNMHLIVRDDEGEREIMFV